MKPDEKVYATPVTIKIELTGNQVRALQEGAAANMMRIEARELFTNIINTYDEHISYNHNTITWEGDE